MFFPRLSGSNVVDMVRNWRSLWNNQIIDLLRSLDVTAGPGIRIDKRPTGRVISAVPQYSGGTQTGTSGLFLVSLNDKGKLEISGGWVNRNGLVMQWYEGETIEPAEGILCICSEPTDKLGKWSDIRARITKTPSVFDSPIAKVTMENGSVSIEQYPVTVAYILTAKRCPIAEL